MSSGDLPWSLRSAAGRTALVVVVAVAVLVGAGGYVAYELGSHDRPDRQSEPVPLVPPRVGLDLPGVARPAAVLRPLTLSVDSRAKAVAGRLSDAAAERALGRHVGIAVDSLGSGRPVLRLGTSDMFTPASTLKLLTATAALAVLGPDHRFKTRTVLAGRTVFLVGGGDPLLARHRPSGTDAADSYPAPATVADLATDTARALHERGTTTVHVAVDASLFAGPSVSPAWEPDYVPADVVSPIVALWVDEGRVHAGFAERSEDPVAAAAETFVTGLRRHGITVRGDTARRTVPVEAGALAQVVSAPLTEVVQHVLEQSDNEAAEVLLRQTAIGAGLPGSFSAGVRAVRQSLGALGVNLGRAVIHDGSGLSRQDALPLSTLTAVIEVAADPGHPALRPVVAGLPVAGFTGTLAYRFVDSGTGSSLGVVRAKTGTLSGVNAMAGVAQARSGDLLAFAAVADRVRLVDTLRARTALDRIASALARCGC